MEISTYRNTHKNSQKMISMVRTLISYYLIISQLLEINVFEYILIVVYIMYLLQKNTFTYPDQINV